MWWGESMGWETHAVTPDRFEDFADVVNRSRRVNHCWCLSHRLQAAEIERLGGGNREQAMRRLCEREHPPGVVTYLDGEPVGWCNIGPRAEITRLARSRLIRPVDDVPVWSIVCVVVRRVIVDKVLRHHCWKAPSHTPRRTARRRWRPTPSTRRDGWI